MVMSRFWLSAVFLLCAAGCGEDFKQTADSNVEAYIQQHLDRVPAVEFFEAGGSYYDDEESPEVDREILLPMLKQLLEISDTGQWVLPSKDDPKRAFAVLVEIPADKNIEQSMARIVEEADKRFDGLILQQWGHRWLSLDFLDQESVEFFKQSDPDFEKQR